MNLPATPHVKIHTSAAGVTINGTPLPVPAGTDPTQAAVAYTAQRWAQALGRPVRATLEDPTGTRTVAITPDAQIITVDAAPDQRPRWILPAITVLATATLTGIGFAIASALPTEQTNSSPAPPATATSTTAMSPLTLAETVPSQDTSAESSPPPMCPVATATDTNGHPVMATVTVTAAATPAAATTQVKTVTGAGGTATVVSVSRDIQVIPTTVVATTTAIRGVTYTAYRTAYSTVTAYRTSYRTVTTTKTVKVYYCTPPPRR